MYGTSFDYFDVVNIPFRVQSSFSLAGFLRNRNLDSTVS